MERQQEENYDFLYYLTGLLSGLFTGLVIDQGFMLVLILGVFGLLFAAFFRQILVKGREKA